MSGIKIHLSLKKESLKKVNQHLFIEDYDGENFGYYLNTQINDDYWKTQLIDYKSFEFKFQTKNKRLDKRMK